MEIFATLKNAITSVVTTKAHLNALEKGDITSFLRQNIDQHSLMMEALSTENDKAMNDWYREKVTPGMKASKNSCKDAYNVYRKALVGKAADAERKRVLGSLAKANESYVKILSEILKNIDKFMDEDSVVIYDVRISQLAILGMLKQSDRLAEFSSYLYSYMIRAANGNLENIPRNRDVFLNNNATAVAEICNSVVNNTGSYSFMREVQRMRENNTDLVLGADNSFSFNGFTAMNGFSASILDNIASALSTLNIFSAAIDAWDDYRLSKHEKNKEVREWMATHVAILKMDLRGVSPDDPKYVQLQNIVKAYDDKIAEYDREIEAFENGD